MQDELDFIGVKWSKWRSGLPGQIQVGASIKIELVLEHSVYGVSRSAIVRDFELGDFLLGGIARGVGCGMRDCSVGMHVALVGLVGVLAEGLDELIRIDLSILSTPILSGWKKHIRE